MTDEELKKIAIDEIRASALPTSYSNVRQIFKIKSLMTANRQRFYNNTNEEKDLILHHVHQKYLNVKNEEDVVVSGGKNLLYFSVFLSDEYVDLLYISLKSIIANTPNINFDVLIMTDAATKVKIQAFDIISNFNVDYMLSGPVNKGPLASLKKLNIFDYEKISEYSKILFFDADIVCIKDLNIIFQKELVPEKLYVCSTPKSTSKLLSSVTHGIMYLSEFDATTITENASIATFNAGQFLFLNSSRMKNHFGNVRWLKNVWPGEYFYEQSFMNYYFVLKSLTSLLSVKFSMFPENMPGMPYMPMMEQQLVAVTYNTQNLNSEFQFFDETIAPRRYKIQVSGATLSNFSKKELQPVVAPAAEIIKDPVQMHGDRTVAIHFAAILARGLTKKEFINLYANAYKLHI